MRAVVTPPMHDDRLDDALRQACDRHANRIALDGEECRLTYRELSDAAHALAAQLRQAKVGKGSAVMVMCSNHPTDFVGFLAVWMTGAAVAPVHRSTPADVVATIQHKAQCVARIDLQDTTALAYCVKLEATDANDPERQRLLHSAALIIFTSGSTGLPKGAVLSHQAFHGKLRENQALFQASTDTVTLLVLNNTFSFGIWVALMTLLQGGRVVVRARFTPPAFLDALIAERVSFVGVVPTMIRATLGAMTPDQQQAASAQLARCGALRQIVIGGEPLGATLSAQLRTFIAPAVLFDVYGLTETSTSDFYLNPRDYPAKASSIGKAAARVRYRIVDDQGQDCPPNLPGQLQIKTPFIMTGYLGDDVLTAQAFDAGWFQTGDLASVDEDGFVSIVGRLKELIVRGGNKITPIEVERALLRCTGIADAMAVGMPDAILGQRIHALLVPAAGQTVDIDSVRRELTAILEKYKFPDVFYIATALPTGRTGKIDRGQLQRWLSEGKLQPVEA
ncbi:MAG: hypothetical protein RL717_418 [Pseudomonadota bacterium]